MKQSMNFEFLRKNWPELADFGAYAEEYAFSDPQSALIKLRSYGEFMVNFIYQTLKLPCLPKASFHDKLVGADFVLLADAAILDKFHIIKTLGNKAAHENKGTDKDAVFAVKQCYQLGAWFYCSYHQAKPDVIPAFIEFTADVSPAHNLTKKLEQKEELYQQAMAELARQQEANEKLLAAAKQTVVVRNEPAFTAFATNSQTVINTLNLNEAETRKYLIDLELRDVGWDVGDNNKSTEQVGQEIEVKHQPTQTGKGYADYVLWDDDGLPLAVVEAKKTAKDARLGKKQAKDYADALEKDFGQRPVMFYTNGHDIYIWDDVQGYPPRKIYSFYSKSSLQHLVKFQRVEKKKLCEVAIDTSIAGRRYQLETLARIHETFEQKRRKALVVQATGTGKTRVSIALTKSLMDAKWAKRILFLCDRKELRKQADKAFVEFLGVKPYVVGKSDKKYQDTARIFIATYPGMMGIYEKFDVGYFDLIIADESHRSIYNVFGNLFKYFDCLQVGLTATPVEMVSRSTCKLFECDYKEPTANYPLEKAIEEGHLVPFEIVSMTTKFMREGMNQRSLTDEQIAELEAQGEDPNEYEFESTDIDKAVLNKDTNRQVLRNLMTNGIKDKDNQLIGKTIIFARKIDHALLLKDLFDKMYPELSKSFCEVIHSKEDRAEALIDQFKITEEEKAKDPSLPDPITLAISVDMLDTGIDVPSVVNLVFAKPVKSKVKFWQMIGRGTRLCKDLFGHGKDKTRFLIFDHWNNFDYFEFYYEEVEPSNSKSLAQKRFELRLQLAEIALKKLELSAFDMAINLVQQDIKSLDTRNINIRDQWQLVEQLSDLKLLKQFAKPTIAMLETTIAPLMDWLLLNGQSKAFRWDCLIAQTQTELINNPQAIAELKFEVQAVLERLPKNVAQVQAKAIEIKFLMDDSNWQSISVAVLEQHRLALREVMYLLEGEITPPNPGPKYTDVKEEYADIEYQVRAANIYTVDYKIYQQKVQEVLEPIFDSNPVIQKIRQGKAVTLEEIAQLNGIIHAKYADLDIETLKTFYPDTTEPLDKLLRSIVGMDARYIEQSFTALLQHHRMPPQAMRIIDMLIGHIARSGGIKMADLDQAPYNKIYEGILGSSEGDVFSFLKTFELPAPLTKAEMAAKI
ncbi:restriction endonuclease subunit R [Alishewanella longhuensis]|uniref:Restriction endonuclease subunit R n=1 Tax=Alishewanella longhuensis TaxID=1091037 RepID=A0ABQ3L1G7_9ALTE|nr:DEAD/DEAH box helicase family protein [Alishewanella longhuensis]GHG74318.1 restriction endonuclease subunit R [Alishewanella longhuensis]